METHMFKDGDRIKDTRNDLVFEAVVVSREDNKVYWEEIRGKSGFVTTAEKSSMPNVFVMIDKEEEKVDSAEEYQTPEDVVQGFQVAMANAPVRWEEVVMKVYGTHFATFKETEKSIQATNTVMIALFGQDPKQIEYNFNLNNNS
jgi:hypothetical protein